MARLTTAESEAKTLLEVEAAKMNCSDYKVERKDIKLFFEQISYSKNPEDAARGIILHVQKYGREFM